MKLKSHVTVAAHPDLMFRMKLRPVGVELGGEASLDVKTSSIRARVGEIPLSVTVPFMAPHRRRVVAGSIGPFALRLAPAEAVVRAFGVRLGGTIGTEGVSAETHVEGRCRAEIDIDGALPARLLKAAVEGVFEE